jgi:hypothetical protein
LHDLEASRDYHQQLWNYRHRRRNVDQHLGGSLPDDPGSLPGLPRRVTVRWNPESDLAYQKRVRAKQILREEAQVIKYVGTILRVCQLNFITVYEVRAQLNLTDVADTKVQHSARDTKVLNLEFEYPELDPHEGGVQVTAYFSSVEIPRGHFEAPF